MQDLIETEHSSVPRIAAVARIARLADYLFGVLYVLLLVRFALEFFNARQVAGFVALIRAMTDPFYAPFKGIVSIESIDGGRVVWPLAIAIVSYMLLHGALRGLLRLIARG